MPNGTYGGVRGGRKSLLLDCSESYIFAKFTNPLVSENCFERNLNTGGFVYV